MKKNKFSLAIILFIFMGCYDTYTILPTEIPRFSYEKGRKAKTVLRTNRKTILGLTPITITTTSNLTYIFRWPVKAKIINKKLIISSSNYSKMVLDMSSIKKVEVEEFQRKRTTFFLTLPAVIAFLGYLAVLIL
jgi:hypothetical protein